MEASCPILSYPIPKNPKFQKFFFEKKNGGVLSAGQGHGNQVFKEVAELSDKKTTKRSQSCNPIRWSTAKSKDDECGQLWRVSMYI